MKTNPLRNTIETLQFLPADEVRKSSPNLDNLGIGRLHFSPRKISKVATVTCCFNWLTNCALRAALQRRRRHLVAVPEKLVRFSFGTVVCFIMFYPHVEWWPGKFGITIKWHPIFSTPLVEFCWQPNQKPENRGYSGDPHSGKQASRRELMSYRCWEFGLKINNSYSNS